MSQPGPDCARPNILLLFPDQHRADWTGANPLLAVRTPNLDALAARGVRFTRAVTPSPLCAPARSCLAAGRHYDRCGVVDNGQNHPRRLTTFYALLRERGYRTLGCGKFDLAKAMHDWAVEGKRLLPEWGFTDGVDNEGKWDGVSTGMPTPRGPYWAWLHERGLAQVHYDDMQRRRRVGKAATFPTALPDDAYCDNWLARVGLGLLRSVPAGEPWFLQVNFTGPHDPWDVTPGMAELYRDADFPQPVEPADLTPEQHVAVRRNYSAMVENIDRWTGEFLAEVGRRGETGRTLVVYASDHGEMLGDHGRWGKGSPYCGSTGVPMVVAGPGVRRGAVHAGPATIMDLAATFLDYGGARRPAGMDSRSMRPLLTGEADAGRDVVLSGLRSWRMACDARFKLVGFDGRPPVLYDLLEDPGETRDVADERPGEVDRFMDVLLHP